MDALGRFSKLNNVLGWGNPEAKIVYIGIEEADDWSLLTLLESFEKQGILEKNDIEKIKDLLVGVSLDKYYTIIDSIIKFIQSKEKGLLYCLDNFLEYYASTLDSTGIRTTDDNGSLNLCPLENFQYYVTKKIVEKDSFYNVCKKNYDNTVFGTTQGNELCLNYYPIGRSTMKVNYPEYYEFFGLRGQERFPNAIYEIERKQIILKFLLAQSNIAKKAIVITLGEQETFKNLFTELFSQLKEVKPIYFEKKGRGQSYFHYQVNNLEIFNTNHPSYSWITYEQIDELLNKYV